MEFKLSDDYCISHDQNLFDLEDKTADKDLLDVDSTCFITSRP